MDCGSGLGNDQRSARASSHAISSAGKHAIVSIAELTRLLPRFETRKQTLSEYERLTEYRGQGLIGGCELLCLPIERVDFLGADVAKQEG
jgi:hypothetical protein